MGTRYAVIDLERLTSLDVRHLADWLARDWDADELFVTRQLDRLKRTVEQLDEPYRTRALEGHAALVRSRLVRNSPWRGPLEQIKLAAVDWERSRPALETCGVGQCQIAYRSSSDMHRHREIFHGA